MYAFYFGSRVWNTVYNTFFFNIQQEDTLSVLNCMASTAAEPQLEYYVVSGEWMATVLDFLQGLVPTKPECQMVNAALVAEHAVSSSSSSSDEEEEEEFSTSTMRRKRKSSWRTQRLQHSHASHYSPKVLKSGLLPNRDYVLVGPHVWTVLSSKFGYDYALPRKVVACREFESKLGVLVHEEEMPIAVPACGYYTYSKDLASPVVADEEEEDADLVSKQKDSMQCKTSLLIVSHILSFLSFPSFLVIVVIMTIRTMPWIPKWKISTIPPIRLLPNAMSCCFQRQRTMMMSCKLQQQQQHRPNANVMPVVWAIWEIRAL